MSTDSKAVELAKIAREAFDNYWTEDCKGDELEAWAASANAAIAAHEAQRVKVEPVAAVERIVHLRTERSNRAYIAGPMTGLPEFNFPAFNAAAEKLRAQGWHVENPAEHGHVEGATWADYLRWDISRIALCGAIYLLPNWEQSKGAALEVTIGRALGIEFMAADGANYPAPQAEKAPSAQGVESETLRIVCGMLGIGSAARDRQTIVMNLVNLTRRNDCLNAIERTLFPERELQDDDGEEGSIYDAIDVPLNPSWGAEPDSYVTQFMAALAARQPPAISLDAPHKAAYKNELDSKEREIEELRTRNAALLDQLCDLDGELREPELFEAQQLRKDAARYRWLRERDLNAIQAGGVFAGMTPENVLLNGEHLDAAIDAATAPEVLS